MATDLVSILIIVLIVVGLIWVWQNFCGPKIQPIEGMDLRGIVETSGSPTPVQPGGRPAPVYTGGRINKVLDFASDPMVQQTAKDIARPFAHCSKRALRRRGNFMTRLHDMSQCLTETARTGY